MTTHIGDQIRVCYNARAYHPAYLGGIHTVVGFRAHRAIYLRGSWPFYARSWIIYRGTPSTHKK